MRTINIIIALLCGSLPACSVDPTPESGAALEEEIRAELEPLVVRGMREDAVDEGADIWMLMCGAANGAGLLPPVATFHCYAEHNQGRAAGKNKCRSSCPAACFALDARWELYCEERAPGHLKNICEQARQKGRDRCIGSC